MPETQYYIAPHGHGQFRVMWRIEGDAFRVLRTLDSRKTAESFVRSLEHDPNAK